MAAGDLEKGNGEPMSAAEKKQAEAMGKDIQADTQSDTPSSDNSSEVIPQYKHGASRKKMYLYITVAVVLGTGLIAVLVYFSVTNALESEAVEVGGQSGGKVTESFATTTAYQTTEDADSVANPLLRNFGPGTGSDWAPTFIGGGDSGGVFDGVTTTTQDSLGGNNQFGNPLLRNFGVPKSRGFPETRGIPGIPDGSLFIGGAGGVFDGGVTTTTQDVTKGGNQFENIVPKTRGFPETRGLPGIPDGEPFIGGDSPAIGVFDGVSTTTQDVTKGGNQFENLVPKTRGFPETRGLPGKPDGAFFIEGARTDFDIDVTTTTQDVTSGNNQFENLVPKTRGFPEARGIPKIQDGAPFIGGDGVEDVDQDVTTTTQETRNFPETRFIPETRKLPGLLGEWATCHTSVGMPPMTTSSSADSTTELPTVTDKTASKLDDSQPKEDTTENTGA